MMQLIQAVQMIHAHAIKAGCERPPALRIVFDTPSDHAKFDCSIGILVEHDSPMTKKATLHGSDHFEIEGINVEICNRDRGSRAHAEKVIAMAAKAHAESRSRTLSITQILALQYALGELLKLVRGS